MLPHAMPRLVLTNANLIDCVDRSSAAGTNAVLPRATVTIDDGRIVAVTSGRAPSKATVIDLGGAYLIPGLWDVHVHLEWPRVPSASLAQLTVQYAGNATRALVEAGVTGMRTAGTPDFIDVALKHAYDAGDLLGPRIFA